VDMMDPVIKEKAEKLIKGAHSCREMSERISSFVRDQVHYCLDEWEVESIEVLRKRRGMCAGKALLAAELHRAVSIPVRFKVIKIFGEEGLFDFLKQKLEEGALPSLLPEEREKIIKDILSLPPYRDHIVLQIVLDGERIDFDIARDTDLDNGMRALGIWKKREIFSEEGIFNSLDGWLRERMERRAVLQGRALFFQVVNQVIDEVRMKGRSTR
jgi:hypothetical protein